MDLDRGDEIEEDDMPANVDVDDVDADGPSSVKKKIRKIKKARQVEEEPAEDGSLSA